MGTGNSSSEGMSAEQGGSPDPAGKPDGEAEGVRLARELTPTQVTVLTALAAGYSPAEAARQAKIDPSTVNRWLNHDPKFIAANNAWMADKIKAGRAGMISVIQLAVDAVRDAISNGNPWIALQVLRDAKLTSLIEPSAVTPKMARQEMKLARQQRDNELVKRELQIKQQQEEIDKLKAQIERYEEKKRLEDEEYQQTVAAWAEFLSEREQEKEYQEKEARRIQSREESKQKHEQWMSESPVRQREHVDHYKRMVEASYRLQLQQEQETKEREQRQNLAEEERRTAEQWAREEWEKERRAREQRAQDQRPGDPPTKSNPDIAPFDSPGLAQGGPPEGVRSEQDPPGGPISQRDGT